MNNKTKLHVEVRLRDDAEADFNDVKECVYNSLKEAEDIDGLDEIKLPSKHNKLKWKLPSLYTSQVDQTLFSETSPKNHDSIKFKEVDDFIIHVYQPQSNSISNETYSDLHDVVDAEDENDEISGEQAASVLDLPSYKLDGIWDNLIFDSNIKSSLLNYIYTTILFSNADVDFNVITWNRIALLHGPPGTGKTSLGKALAQKLSIRLSDHYVGGKLIEINSHSLFSKWFSESGKLVQKLFSMINSCIDDPATLIVVLIDEVESLTGARQAAVSGNEPSDAIRVVNALLTQIDKLKHRKNALVITTSNITGAIDDAFIDRADIKQYIGLPSQNAIEKILETCIEELMKTNLIEGEIIPGELSNVALRCQEKQLSGRSLRKLPLLAYSQYVDPSISLDGKPNAISVTMMIEAMSLTLDTSFE